MPARSNDFGNGLETSMTKALWVVLFAIVFVGCGDDAPLARDAGMNDASRDSAAVDASGDAATPPAFTPRLTFETITLDGAPEALTEFKFIPGTSEFLMLLKSGEVLHYSLAGNVATQLGSFTIDSVDDQSDCGLISLAFDPDFESNRLVYFAYCDSHDYSRISRHVFDGDDYSTIASTGTLVIRVGMDGAPEAWHNVGSIGFDEDGHMWAIFGEKATGRDHGAPAQRLDSNLGKVLRFDPNRVGEGYTAVATNPFVGRLDANPEVAALGLRSPWRGALDSRGRLWVGDVGPDVTEEVNVIDFTGKNYGWPTWQGPCESNCDGLTDPVIHWNRSSEHPYSLDDEEVEATSRRVVWVGLEYRGGENDRYAGSLTRRMIVGDFCGGFLRAVEVDDGGDVVFNEHVGHLEGVTAMDVGPDGYVYVSSYGNCLTWPYQPGSFLRVHAEPRE